MSTTWKLAVTFAATLAIAASAPAEQPAGAAERAAVAKPGATVGKALAVAGASIGAAAAVIGGAVGISRIGRACVESMARQPEASGAMFAPMLITAAMVESGMLFAVVVALLAVLLS
jgi:F-type H+-transporting ATPase subunit c